MSDKFFNPVEVPVILDVPTPEAGFARIYGRGDDAYALFGDGTEKKLTGGVVVVAGGDRDISFEDTMRLDDTFTVLLGFGDTSAVTDAANYGFLFNDSTAVSDEVKSATLEVRSNDSLATSDATKSEVAFSTGDTAELSDSQLTTVRTLESSAASDTRQDAILDVQNWADTIVSFSNVQSLTSATDLNETTICFLNAQQTALSGSVTTTGQVTVSMAPYTTIPAAEINSVKLVWGWRSGLSGLLQSGNSVDVDFEYSLDDGSSFTTIDTITATNSQVDVETVLTATYAELLRLQFRLTGSVTSGTAAGINARQFCGLRYVRAEFNATQTL